MLARHTKPAAPMHSQGVRGCETIGIEHLRYYSTQLQKRRNEHYEESAMAELAGMLASALLKVVAQNIASAIRIQVMQQSVFTDDLEGLKMTLESVAALLNDAERRSVEEEAVRLWLKRLKDAIYGIDDMIDEIEAGTKPTVSKVYKLPVHKLSHT